MPSLNAEFGRKLAILFRHYQQMQAENLALRSMLDYAESEGHLPVEGWRATLDSLLRKDTCRSIVERFESEIAELESAPDVQVALRLLVTLHPSPYKN
jgi:hypothetical protein